MSIQRSLCFFNLCSSCSSRSNKHGRDCLLPPPRGRLCCRGGLTTPYYSHRWPGPVATVASHRNRTSEPSYSSPCGHPLPRLPRLCVVPFLGLAVVHRPGALGRCGQHGQGTASIGRGLYVERLTAGSTAAARKCLLITRKIMIPPPDIRNPPKWPLYFMKKTLPPLTARAHQLYLRTQGSASLLRTKK